MRRLAFLLFAGAIGIAAGLLPEHGKAQTEGGAKKGGTRLITLGAAGGPNPRAHRAQSSNALVVNGRLYVIDAGDGVARQLVKAGLRFIDAGTIFITHDHDDHSAGLAVLLAVQWDAQRKTPINVYGPPGTAALVKGAMQFLSVNAEIRWVEGRRTPLGQVIVGHEIGTGEIYKDDNIRVTAIENTHFHHPAGTPPYGKYKSYSYRFETPDRTIVFTGDTGPSDALTELAKGADVLVTEVTSLEAVKQALSRGSMTPEEQAAFLRHIAEEHVTGEDIGNMATRANIKSVVLTHLPPPLKGDQEYKNLIDDVKRHSSGQVRVAKDLMEF